MTDINNIKLGPLAALIGQWYGETGEDVSPEPDGVENNQYCEHLEVTPLDRPVTNAESQELSAVYYCQRVFRKSDNKSIHHETGYWLWDAENKQVINSLTIPRGVTILAGGTCASVGEGEFEFSVAAQADDSQWSINQTAFMQSNALTRSFKRQLQVKPDSLSYQQQISLEIYGRSFEHTDAHTLVRHPQA